MSGYMLQGRPGGLRQTVHQGGQTHEVVFTTTALARDAEGSLEVNAGRPVGRYYRPLVDNRPFCLNGRYS